MNRKTKEFEWLDPITPPKETGKYLVITTNGPEIVECTETGYEYADGDMADPDEWEAWAFIPKRKRKSSEPLQEKINNYLATGGLFNPEMANHDNVRNLLTECLDYLVMETSEFTE